VSTFSSRGPTYDYRIKPDVVAPGEKILSAAARGAGPSGSDKPTASSNGSSSSSSSSSSCAATYMSGTSMAAPLLAGHAALVRQYFRGGTYTAQLIAQGLCRAPYACKPAAPSGALLKALLINAGVPVTPPPLSSSSSSNSSPDDSSAAASEAPATAAAAAGSANATATAAAAAAAAAADTAAVQGALYAGFGRVQLNTTLMLQGPVSGGPVLFTLERNTTSRETTTLRVTLPPQRSHLGLKVTLVWMDPPASVVAARQLVHDLDLEVLLDTPSSSAGSTQQHLGNERTAALRPASDASSSSSSSSSSTSGPQPDRHNNVEQVELSAEQLQGIYSLRVQVHAYQLLESRQSFALVVSGAGEVQSASSAVAASCPEGSTGQTVVVSHAPSCS
jgi:Subtilase family